MNPILGKWLYWPARDIFPFSTPESYREINIRVAQVSLRGGLRGTYSPEVRDPIKKTPERVLN